VPLVTWHYDDARVHCAVLKIRAVPTSVPPRSSTLASSRSASSRSRGSVRPFGGTSVHTGRMQTPAE